MPNYFDQFDEAGGTPAPAESNVGNFFDQFDEPTNARPERTLLGTAKDIGITALKGAINLPQAFVGLGDIATGGRVGKYLEEAGYRPEDAKQLLDEGLSPAQQYANQQVDNAQGFSGTLEALKDNPSAVATTVVESLPQMLGGAGIARGLLTTAPRMAPLVAGAVGEGAVAAGSSAEQIRNKTEDGLLTPGQQVAAALSGVGTAGLGVLGGKFAQKLGIGDMDTALAGGLADTRRNFFARLAGHGITEGIFEEMPQSAQEQMWQNFALGKPLDEGVSEAAATGLAAGSLTGAGFEAGRSALGGFENRTQPSAIEDQLLDDGADQSAQANDQSADQQPQALGYSPQRMITMPDGTTAWEGDLQQQRQQLGEAPPAARNHPGFSELHKTADQIEAELGSGLDIDSEIAALENDLNLIQYQPAPIRNMDGRGQTITIDATGKRVKTTLQDDPVQPFATNGSEIDYTPEGPPAANADTGLSLADQNGIEYQPNADYQDPAKINQLSGSLENQMADYAKSQRLSVLPQGFDDERLARDEYRNILEGLGNQLTPGGDISYTRDGQDRITGRTSSVNPDWFKNLPPEEKLSVVDTQDAIKKALAGQKLGVRQTRLVKRLLDEASGVRSNQAEHLKAQRQETNRARLEALKSFWDEMPDTGNDPFGIHQENVAELFNEDNYEPEATYDDRSIAEMASQAEAMGADWRDVDKALDSGDSAQSIQALSQLIYGLRNEHRPTRTTPNSAAPGAAQAGYVQPGRSEAPVESVAGESADVAQPAETGRAGEVAPTVKESLTAESIDSVANEAATSPTNDLPEPTQAMKDAGNYKKAHLRLHGLDIAIENPKGSMRRGTDKDGKAWESEMQAHYGYVKRTTGADGDQVDVFIGEKPESDKVFVIDQYHPDGTFDEHKVVMGASSMLEAKSLYKRNYQKGWKVGPTTAMSVDEFKAWLKSGDTTKPLSAPGNLPVKTREESSISIPPQSSNDAASSDNLARGEKSASKEQSGASSKSIYRIGKSTKHDTVTVKENQDGTVNIFLARNGLGGEYSGSLDGGKRWLKSRLNSLGNAMSGKDMSDKELADMLRLSEGENKLFPGSSPSMADRLKSMSDSDFDGLLDDIFAESPETTIDTAKPRAKRPKKTGDGKKLRKTATKPEVTNTDDKEAVKRTAGEIAKSMGGNLGSAAVNALEGLTKLFGGANNLNMGVSFDEQTYAKAKPHFEAVWKDFQAAGRDLADFVRAIRDNFGAGVKPYLSRFAKEKREELLNVANTGNERDSGNRTNEVEATERSVQPEKTGARGRGAGQPDGQPGNQGFDFGDSVPSVRPTANGERSGGRGEAQQSSVGARAAGAIDDRGGPDDGAARLYAERAPDGAIEGATEQAAAVGETSLKPVPGEIKQASASQIKARMPFLTDGQVEDVVFAEKRLAQTDGFGVMFTNGTGTGKTFTGLGIVRRMLDAGKKNVLIVAPKQTILDGWKKAASGFFGIDASILPDTKSNGGGGVVGTTYAALASNNKLSEIKWDAIVADESHYLSSDETGNKTEAQKSFDALAGNNARRLASMLRPDLYERAADLRSKISSYNKSDNQQAWAEAAKLEDSLDAVVREIGAHERAVIESVEAVRPQDKARVVFLSATPFAYDKNIQYANGYLFDWGSDKDGLRYNSGGNREQFFMQHFGYSMRYNRLTTPDARVDSGLMERNFNATLKAQGVLSGRALDSDFDYDRRFVLAESKIGKRVDDAIKWLNEAASGKAAIAGGDTLRDEILKDKFDYHARMYFLEAIKAREALPYIESQLGAGRNVLVMHDFKKGGTLNPFSQRINNPDSALQSAYAAFKKEFKDLIGAFEALPSPIDLLSDKYPGALIYNGNVSARERIKLQDMFNDDTKPPMVMIAQGDAMREGVSIHDTTGKRQRVLIHLGMPVKPTAAIQQEGRIYRTGQKSNALFRYFTIGTAWERMAFASKIAGRAGTAENLAMGEEARGLKQSFIDAYEDAQDWPVGYDGEGVGGKAEDRARAQNLTRWDQAKAYYFGTKKQGKGRSSAGREGNDYFATPEPVGLKMVEWSGAAPGDRVLEPSAGHGAISRWFPEGAKVRAIEQSADLASRLTLHTDGDVINGNFEDHHIVNKYDAIVMNPPYGVGGSTAIAHLAKAAQHLAEGGRVVALIPTGPAADKKFDAWLFGKDAKGKNNEPDLHLVMDVSLPSSTFERAGTSVSTRIVVIEKVSIGSEHVTKIRPSKNISLNKDLSIEELFDSIENISAPPKATPIQEEVEAPKKGKSTEVGEVSGNKIITDAPEVECTTKKGKLLKGVLLDMPLDKAREIDKYSWVTTINGVKGAFVRMEYIQRPESMFSLGDTGGIPISQSEVAEVINRVQSSFGAKLKITVVASAVELPPEVQAHMEKNGIAGNKVKGVFHGGSIFVNREALQTAQDVETVILHELAHVGLAKMFGADIQAAMGSLYLAMGGDKTLRELATKYAMPLEKYQAAYASAKPAERLGFMTEELLAHIAENNKPSVKRFLKELIGAIRSWLRSKGFLSSAELSESELFALLKEVRQFAAADSNSIRYSLSDSIGDEIEVDGVMRPTTNSNGQEIHHTEEGIKNFWRWFRDSKVVDGRGRPLVVYHGTGTDFSKFDKAKIGKNFEDEVGFYFTNNTEHDVVGGTVYEDMTSAGAYARLGDAPNVVPAFVLLKNPLIIKGDSDGAGILSLVESRSKSAGSALTNALEDGHDGVIVRDAGARLRSGEYEMVVIASEPEQIKSAIGNTGEFNPDNPDIRYSLSDGPRPSGGFSLSGVKKVVTDAFKSEQRLAADRARENLPGEIRDSLDRLGDPRTVRARVRDAARRWLTPSGLLTKDVHKLKLERDGQLNGDEFHASIRLQGFYDAVKEGYQKEYEYLVPATKARLNQAMRGEDVRIPEQVKTAIAHMRDQIKRLSAVHMEQLLDDAAALEAQGDDAGAAAKLRLAETIAGNFETYLHRSYRAFDDPDWPNKVRKNHPEVYAAAVNYLANGYADGGPVTREHLDLAKKKVALMLEEGTAFDSLGAFISESKLGAKDLSIIKRRKTIAPEILALLGEYEDAPINYTKSVAKMSRLVYNHAFLKKLREHGFEAGLFSEIANTNLGHNKKIAGDASETYAPLNGLYTTHEFHQALVDAMGKETEMWWYRQLVSINGMVKFGKTVLSPPTALRNLYSAMFFSLTNGHFDFSKGKNFSWSTYFAGKPDALAYMEKLRRLGVVYDNPYAGEMMALLKDSRLDETVFNWKPFKWTKTGIDYAQKFYGFGDDLWKIIGFENEKAMLIKDKGMSEAAAEVEAAERIRNTYPTYSLIPKAVNALRRFPLVGTFVSFPAEIIRTSYHIVRYLGNDIRELGIKNPMVQRKALGLLIASASMYALQAITKALVGVDDDEEKALRLMSPEWQKNSNLAYLGRDEKGALQTMDMSFLDPYGYFKRPFNALLQDQPLGDALKSGVKDLWTPFFGQDITFGAIMDAAMNKKDTGGRVFNPEDTVANQTLDISAHIAKAVQPGIVTNITRMYMASTGKVTASGKKFDVGDELAALGGFRWGTFDPKTSMYYQTFAFTDAKADASKILTAAIRDPNKVDEEELRDAFDTAMRARAKAYDRMAAVVAAAEKSGLSKWQINKTLRDSGISNEDARALISGATPKWKLEQSAMRSNVRRAGVLFSQEVADEIKRRQKIVRDWSK